MAIVHRAEQAGGCARFVRDWTGELSCAGLTDRSPGELPRYVVSEGLPR